MPPHSRPHATHRSLLRIFAVLLVVLFFIVGGATVGLYLLGRRVQGILNQAPAYTSQEYAQKAQDQIAQGSYQTAESYLEQALLKENNPDYRGQLAVVKYRLKKYGEAVDQYQQLLNQKADPGFAYNGIGNAYRDWADSDPVHKQEYQQKAVQAYRQAIAANPSYVAAYSNLALLLSAQGEADQAKAVLDQGLAAIKPAPTELSQLRDRLQGK